MSRKTPSPIEFYCDAVYDMVKAKDRVMDNQGTEDAALWRPIAEKNYTDAVKKVEEALQVLMREECQSYAIDSNTPRVGSRK